MTSRLNPRQQLNAVLAWSDALYCRRRAYDAARRDYEEKCRAAKHTLDTSQKLVRTSISSIDQEQQYWIKLFEEKSKKLRDDRKMIYQLENDAQNVYNRHIQEIRTEYNSAIDAANRTYTLSVQQYGFQQADPRTVQSSLSTQNAQPQETEEAPAPVQEAPVSVQEAQVPVQEVTRHASSNTDEGPELTLQVQPGSQITAGSASGSEIPVFEISLCDSDEAEDTQIQTQIHVSSNAVHERRRRQRLQEQHHCQQEEKEQQKIWTKEDLVIFTCPITKEIMTEPVSCPEGYTFERDAIIHWLESNPRNPLTRTQLHPYDLVPNRALKDIIQTKNIHKISEQLNEGERSSGTSGTAPSSGAVPSIGTAPSSSAVPSSGTALTGVQVPMQPESLAR